MKEQLFIIVNNERKELDIKGGGVTLTLNNPLIAGVDKIKYSHSYTISLPMTERNISALDMFGELGYKSTSYGRRYNAEYWVGGAPSIINACLYVTGISGDSYLAALVCVNSAAMETMRDGGLTLRDIWQGNEWVTWNIYQYDNHSTRFDNTALAVFPMYNAGVKAINELTSGLPFITGQLEEDGEQTRLCPPPCVPIATILRRLATMGINWGAYFQDHIGALSHGEYTGLDDILTYGVVPCVTTAVSKERGAERWGVTYKDPEYIGPYEEGDHATSFVVGMRTKIGSMIHGIGYGGHLDLDIKGLRFSLLDATNLLGIDIVAADNWETLAHEKHIATIYPTQQSDTEVIFDQVVKIDDVIEWSAQTRLYLVFEILRPYFDVSLPRNMSIKECLYFDEGHATHDIFIPDCLPNVKVWDFMRTLLAMIRCVPNEHGNKLLMYDTLNNNVSSPMDWSGKVVKGSGIQPYKEYDMKVDGLSQHNYTLMANEQTDSNDGGGYEVTKCEFVANNPFLQMSGETLKSEFFAPYTHDPEKPFNTVGGTIKYWQYTDVAGVYDVDKAEPCIGRVKVEQNTDGTERLGLEVCKFDKTHWDTTLGAWFGHPEIVVCEMLLTITDLEDAQEWTRPVYIEELRGVYAIVSIDYNTKQISKVKLLKIR